MGVSAQARGLVLDDKKYAKGRILSFNQVHNKGCLEPAVYCEPLRIEVAFRI